MCGFLLNNMYGIRETTTNLMTIVTKTQKNLKFEIRKVQSAPVQRRSERERERDITFIRDGDDFVILAKLDPDESGLKKITLLNRIVRYQQTINGVPFLDSGTFSKHSQNTS